ncbi:MAG: hypothetical protein R3B49_11040 [Phycisphaerales bacterium]
MLRKSITVGALAGLASGVFAVPTIHFTANVTDAVPGDTVTWTVSVTGLNDGPFQDYLQGYDFNIIASHPTLGIASTFSDGLDPVLNPTPGTAAGFSILGVSGGQSSIVNFPGIVFGNVILGTFTVHIQSSGTLSYTIADGGVFALTDVLQVKNFFNGGDQGPDVWNGQPLVVSDTVYFYPSPASFAPLALAGLAACRRRR